MAKLEKDVKKKIRAILDSFGDDITHYMPATHGYGKSGIHDHKVCFHGLYISIEAKATADHEPTALQIDHAKDVVRAGGNALLIHEGNTDEVRNLLTRIQRGEWERGWYLWPGLFDTENDV